VYARPAGRAERPRQRRRPDDAIDTWPSPEGGLARARAAPRAPLRRCGDCFAGLLLATCSTSTRRAHLARRLQLQPISKPPATPRPAWSPPRAITKPPIIFEATKL